MDEQYEIKRLLEEWEEAKIEAEEGASKMGLAESELEEFGVFDPATYQLPDNEE